MSAFSGVVLRALVLVAVVALGSGKAARKPASSYFTLCSREDTKALSECAKKNFIAMKPSLKTGIPSLEIPPFDPMFVPKLTLREGTAFTLTTTMTNVTFRGVSELIVNSVNMSMNGDQLLLDFSILVPEMTATGLYNMDGNILTVPFSGKGRFEINNTDLVIDFHSESKAVTRAGKKHLKMDEVKTTVALKGKGWSWYHNLFNGDKLLGDATNNLVNENYRDFFEATKHMPEGLFSEVVQVTLDHLFAIYPVDELFLK